MNVSPNNIQQQNILQQNENLQAPPILRNNAPVRRINQNGNQNIRRRLFPQDDEDEGICMDFDYNNG
jgi:hypothetical protein